MASALNRLKSKTQPLDRLAIVMIVGLLCVLGLLILGGDRTAPKIRDFSWANQSVGAEDTAFVLTFNRPMNWQSVEKNIQISPPLSGKTSWSGRRLAYTLTQPVPYGQSFQLNVKGAEAAQGGTMVPFSSTIKSRDLAFAYLGVNGEEAGRIILYDKTQDKKTILTPANLSVLKFKAYPKGDRLLFSATDRTGDPTKAPSARLYRVSTGSGVQGKLGDIEQVLDNQDYQILKFDLSADGDRIVVERAPLQNMMDANLWQIRGNDKPATLKTQGGGDFLIAPDSQTLVLAQGKGLALISLDEQNVDKPLDFLPKFGMVLNFNQDGSAATMVKFNTDYTQSLFLVTNQGVQKELLRIKGSIQSSAFAPDRNTLYCLVNRLISENPYQEQPSLSKVDLKTGKVQELLTLPVQHDIKLSLAPDGSQLLFDQSSEVPSDPGQAPLGNARNIVSLDVGAAAMSTTSSEPKVQAVGRNPQWLP